jgi:hypothetical protein
LPYTDVRAGLDPNLQRGSRLYDDAIFRVFDLLIFDDGTQSVFWRWQVGSAWALIFQGNKALASPGECKESIRLCESSLTKRPLTLRGQRGGRCPWCRPSPMPSKLANQNLRRPPFRAYQERKPTHCPSLRQTSEVSGEPPVRTTSEVLR